MAAEYKLTRSVEDLTPADLWIGPALRNRRYRELQARGLVATPYVSLTAEALPVLGLSLRF
jgi:hypothetical protein